MLLHYQLTTIITPQKVKDQVTLVVQDVNLKGNLIYLYYIVDFQFN